MARQKRIARGSFSTSPNIVAPVVVKPETLSKRASTGLGVTPVIIKGILPRILVKNQAKDTRRNPSPALKEMVLDFPKPKARTAPLMHTIRG
jgi:hypothetical protein